ncbi:cache domain-containing sensor histidine kinase [Lysinibacillus piscis]|uniref:Histidine kinase n=1 Tax=Lysinibacillus piscis TaxID=2518931 RepID=A0ABQ5NNG9_9BACI|nr:sensor histidine kinase [Lysinibacillus sp. KH24]GLC89658.1 histidine kinase [Lysinibacillus sp. KH24]
MLFSLRNRLFLLFTLLLTVPFILLSIIIPWWFMGIMKNQTEDITFEMLGQYSLYIESITTQAEDLGKQILIHHSTQSWLQAENAEGAESPNTRLLYRDLKELLSSIMINNSSGMTASVVYKDGRGIWVTTPLQGVGWLSQGMKGEQFLSYHYDVDQMQLDMRKKPINSYILPLFDMRTFETSGVIKVNFPSALLQEAIKQVEIGENGRAYVLNKEGRNVIPVEHPKPKKMSLAMLQEIQANTQTQGLIETGSGSTKTILFYQKLPVDDWIVVSEVAEVDLFANINNLQRSLWIASIILFGITIAASYFIASTIVSPLGKLARAMRFVEKGDFEKAKRYMPHVQAKNNEVAYLIGIVEHTIAELKRLIDTEYEANIRRKGAEYKALLLQINPHFMNNTLEVISSLAAQERHDDVMNVSSYLGKMMRYSLDTKRITVPLAEEMQYIRSYMKILALRYEEDLTSVIEEDPEAQATPVLKFILQPLVENAVKYSFIENSKAHIVIRAVKEEERLKIIVQDSGMGMTPDILAKFQQLEKETPSSVLNSKGESIGLTNVLERMRLYYGPSFSYDIHSEVGIGTTITLELILTGGQ